MDSISQLMGMGILSWAFGSEPNEEVKLYLGRYFEDKDIEETLDSLGEIPEDIRPKLSDMLNECVELYKKKSNLI